MPRFQKHEHLLTPAQFQQVYDRRQSVADSIMIVYARENGLPYSRIGLSISKKYGGAVQRVRLRRLYREAFRLLKEELPVGLDFVLIPRGREEPTFASVRHSLVKLVRQVHKKIAKDVKAKE